VQNLTGKCAKALGNEGRKGAREGGRKSNDWQITNSRWRRVVASNIYHRKKDRSIVPFYLKVMDRETLHSQETLFSLTVFEEAF